MKNTEMQPDPRVSDYDDWRERAIKAEEEVRRLRGLLEVVPPRPCSVFSF
jgi:hypothetical protein